MGALLGLLGGLGMCLIFFAMTRLPVDESVVGASGAAPKQRRSALSPESLPPGSVVASCLGTGVAVCVVAALITQTWPVALAFGAISTLLPWWLHQGKLRRTSADLAAVWPEAVDHLASAVRAGLSLPEALSGLATRGPEQLRPAFAQFATDYQVTGRFAESLDRLKSNLADPTGDRVVEGLRIAREVGGGDLGRLLRNLSGYLRDEARTRSELESRQSWTVNGARLAVVAPWLVLLFLSFQPRVMSAYNTAGGAVVLTAGAGLSIVAYAAMMRIGRLPQARRVLQ